MYILFCVNYLGEAKEMRGFWDFVIREREEERKRDDYLCQNCLGKANMERRGFVGYVCRGGGGEYKTSLW
jgi:hypothetical protein